MKQQLIIILSLLLECAAKASTSDGRIFRAFTASDGLTDNSAQTLKCTLTGRMTISTLGNINYYDGALFTHIGLNEKDKYPLELYNGHSHLYYDNIHHLWLKGSHYVSCVNLATERFYSNVDSIFKQLGMNEKVLDMFVDMNGNVWMMGDGYLQSNACQYRFPVDKGNCLHDIEVYDKKLLILFYYDGVTICFDLESGKKTGRYVTYKEPDISRFKRSSVLLTKGQTIYQIRNGNGGGILLSFDVEKLEWSELFRSEYHLNNMVVRNDMLYIASEWGYFTYDIPTKQVVHYKQLQLTDGRKLDTDINTLEFDRQGGLWAGTEKRGLLYARPMNSPIRSLTWDNPEAIELWKKMEHMEGITEFNGMRANVMLVDSRQWTWVGAYVGLYLYKSPQSNPIIIRRKDGMFNDIIHSIIEDDDNNIWVGTSYGISCVQIGDNEVKNVYSFNDYDNVPNESFINAKAVKLEDGTIAMQSLDHVVTFNPADFGELILKEPIEMHPKLTRLLVNGINVSAGDKVNGDVIIEKAITRTREINLNYNQNSISLVFSALNFARPLHTYYRVRVKELDGENWKEYSYFDSKEAVDNQGLLHYAMLALNPGDYHVELQASLVPGKWVGDPLSITIHVNEPWWSTTGVLLLLLLFVLSLLMVNVVMYTRNMKLRMRRNALQEDFIRRLRSFVERYETYCDKKLSPLDANALNSIENIGELNPTFITMMMKLIPYISENKDKTISLNKLNQLANENLVEQYHFISNNLYKSPRMLVISMRIEEAGKKLRTTDDPIEKIASDCGFASPSFFIASFFRQYKQTPEEYRLTAE